MSSRIIRFGVFEADLQTRELRRGGLKVKLYDQPFRVLALLLLRPGELVTREEIRSEIWSDGTFVDFDHSLNRAVHQIRLALGDASDNPRFIETLSGRGYRFIAPVTVEEARLRRESEPGIPSVVAKESRDGPEPTPSARPVRFRRKRWGWALGAALLVLVGVAVRLSFAPNEPGRIESIAVLPVADLSSGQDQAYFADGMTDALIGELARIDVLRVISRTTMMRYKGGSHSVPEIARELDVDALVEGTVLRSGEQVHVSVRLIDGATEKSLWTGSFRRDSREIPALQSEIVRAIATKIGVRLTAQEEERFQRSRPVDRNAHEAYLKGNFYWNKRTWVGMRSGIEYFEEAVALDPTYAPAHAGLAEALSTLSHTLWGFLDPRDAMPRAEASAREALRIDETRAEPHAVLGFIHENYHGDRVAAERELRRAVELNPGSASAHLYYAWYLSASRRHEESLAHVQRARDLDPLSLVVNQNVATMSYYAGRFDLAVEQCQRVIDLELSFAPGHAMLGLAYIQDREYVQGLEALQEALRRDRESSNLLALAAYAYAKADRDVEARRLLDEIQERSAKQYVPAYSLAVVYQGLGEEERALAELERAHRERQALAFLNVDPIWDGQRSNPRFKDLLRRIGFARE